VSLEHSRRKLSTQPGAVDAAPSDIDDWDPKWNEEWEDVWDPQWVDEFGSEWDEALRLECRRELTAPRGEALRWYNAIVQAGYVPKARSVARAIAGICEGNMQARTTWRRIAELGAGGRNDAAKLSLDAMAKAGLVEYRSTGKGRGAYTEVRLIQPDFEPVRRGGARQWAFQVITSQYDQNRSAA
jgi:hypothetical protein